MGHLGGFFLLLLPLIRLQPAAAAPSGPSCPPLDFQCGDGSCINNQRLCDGQTDCRDGSDEAHCRSGRCKPDEFSCRSRRCVSSVLRCDGVDDCADGSDEASCPGCPAGVFSCGPADACLPRDKVCDGQTDCKDGRDELEAACGGAEPLPHNVKKICEAGKFRCGDGHCIRQTWRCDHSPDCTDGSDEVDCDQNECLVQNGGCSHRCVDQPMGFLCSCPDNMRLLDDTQCEEVDGCLESDVCDQLCVYVNATSTCGCQQDYRLNPDSRECRAEGGEAQLVFTASKGLQSKSISGPKHEVLAPQLPGPGPVAAEASRGLIYWAQRGRSLIYRISLDEEPRKAAAAAVLLEAQGSVTDLTVDWINRLLYWTSAETGSVNVALLDGSAQRRLVSNLDQPCAVDVDPLRGRLFWSQCGGSPRIERAGLDGLQRTVLVSSSIRQPVALSLDEPRQLLYWFDQKTRSISRVDLEGRHRKTVVESNGYLDRVFGLAVFEGFVYWTDEVTRSICRADKRNGRNLTVLESRIPSPGGVAVVHSALQPHGPSACERLGSVCQPDCVVDLLSDGPSFRCVALDNARNTSREIPSISRTLPAQLSDPTMAGILSLIMFFSVLLAGLTVWWWRAEFRPAATLTVLSFSLKDSQDTLLLAPGPPRTASNSSPAKETLLKQDLDAE